MVAAVRGFPFSHTHCRHAELRAWAEEIVFKHPIATERATTSWWLGKEGVGEAVKAGHILFSTPLTTAATVGHSAVVVMFGTFGSSSGGRERGGEVLEAGHIPFSHTLLLLLLSLRQKEIHCLNTATIAERPAAAVVIAGDE